MIRVVPRLFSLYRSGGATVVCGCVSSRNSFGGFSGSQRFISNVIGISVLEEQAEDMGEVWGRFCN